MTVRTSLLQPEMVHGVPDSAAALSSAAEAKAAPTKAGLLELVKPADARSHQFNKAFDEYCKQFEAGSPPDRKSFCSRFPRIKSALLRGIVAHDFLEEHPEWIDRLAEGLWPQLGQPFLNFIPLQELGRGAFARVYLAAEPALGDRHVVVKVSPCGTAEANTLGRLNHPNIVPVHSVGQHPVTGLSVVCMPYLGSATLGDVLDHAHASGTPPTSAAVIRDALDAAALPGQPRPELDRIDGPWRRGSYIDGVVDIAVQVADALAYMHSQNLVHGDLKPSNVLMSRAGKPTLLDFNLSIDRRLEIDFVGGTLPYMAPEQLQATVERRLEDFAVVDGRADLFALGVLLFELLSGQHPFGPLPHEEVSPTAFRDLLLERLPNGPASLAAANPRVDKSLARLVEHCLAYDPKARPQSAAELALRLRARQSAPRRLRRWLGRHALKVACAAALVVTLLGATAYGLAHREPAAERLIREGKAAYEAGAYSDAATSFAKALDADQRLATLPEVYYMKGRALQQQGTALELQILACTDEAERGALQLQKQRDYLDAWHLFEEALRLAPGTDFADRIAGIHACIGFCGNQINDHTGAILAYEEALRRGFVNAEVLNNLAFSFVHAHRFHEAGQRFERALQLNPNLQVARNNRARLALRHAQTTLDNDMAALSGASFAEMHRLLQTSLPDPGVHDIEEAIRLGPPCAELHRDAAHSYAFAATQKSRRIDAALRRLENSYGLYPANRLVSKQSLVSVLPALAHAAIDTIHERIVDAARDQQLTEQAIGHLNKAVELGYAYAAIQDDSFLKSLLTHASLRGVVDHNARAGSSAPAPRFADPVRDLFAQ